MNRNKRRSAIAISLVLCLALLLSACQRERPAADEPSDWAETPTGETATTPAAPGEATTPAAGQTVISIEGEATPAPEGAVEQPTAEAAVPVATVAPAPEVVIPVGPIFEYVVRPGDTLFSIAQTYGTDVETLRRLNNLPDDTIQSGQTLTVPGSGGPAQPGATPAAPAVAEEFVYTVQLGDTLSSIASQFGVDWQTIAGANNIAGPNYTIFRGQRLVIPGVTPTPVPTVTHTIVAGETLYSIAVQYGVTLQELMSANNITNADLIYQGQVLVIPQ